MGASGKQAAAGQPSAKCQGAGQLGSALRAPDPPRIYLRLLPLPPPRCPVPSQMGTLAKDGLEALRGREGLLWCRGEPQGSLPSVGCQPPALPL